MPIPEGVEAWKSLGRKAVTQLDGRCVFSPIIASFDGFSEPCPFLDYCRWLIERLREMVVVEIVNWPQELEFEDFINIKLSVLMTTIDVSLDWGIGIAIVDVPSTPRGEEILLLIEQANSSAG